MSQPLRPKSARGLVPPVERERRRPAGATGSLGWLRSVLGRPLGFVRRNGKLHLVLLDRRRPRDTIEAEAVARIAEELRVRLLAHPSGLAAAAMRQAARVHDVLADAGWDAVQALPALTLGAAAVQVRLLATEAPSPLLDLFIEHLRTARVAAEVREEKAQQAAAQRTADQGP